MFVLLLGAAVWAGAQNALAGGGSFITLPALILSGMDPRAANITSTVALFPGQVTTGWAGRKLASGAENLSLRAMVAISLVGGAIGALLLLVTPPRYFEALLPWLVLFATAAFAWGTFSRRPVAAQGLKPAQALALQFFIAIYGGYFGGGIGFLMLAVLSMAQLPVRASLATKNVLASVMNGTAVVVFLFSGEVRWLQAATLAVGAVGGGLAGAWLLRRANERFLRLAVIAIGVALTIGLFIRAYR
jgi:hypothetical protein